MAWIKTISYEEAEGTLLKLYDCIKGPDNNVDNFFLAHSLRPHVIEAHMRLYKGLLHHPRNTVSEWFLEALGLYTSMLNYCTYCVEHHNVGLSRLLNDASRSQSIRQAFESNDWQSVFDSKETAALDYARKLTEKPVEIDAQDIESMRYAGWDDGQILEINQVIAYFNYANRFVLGLGVSTEGDVLGLSPGDMTDLDNWHHE